ncbi:MAG TPA: response regulator transcription factor [Spirochaetota bacterium]|nr:MAG: Heme response regulator HssR [Spirochaetes bacterium ADurb.BinA120]HNU90318.1 response regulator transcription factor [Spirochaetota bacterium]HPV96441.1 response regulator transcription factor [Spirochaetota bacterium]
MDDGSERAVGLLSESGELIDDFAEQYAEHEVRVFRSVDAVRGDGLLLLGIDADMFESSDLIQFHLSRLRKKLQGVPVLLILRVGHLEDLDHEWFYDEFVLFPFRKNELRSRVRGLLRERKLSEDGNVIVIGNVRIDLPEYSVYLSDEKIECTYKEFELLRLLAQNRGTVFSRKDLLAKIWGVEYIGGTRTVDVHIRRLRGKLGDEFNSVIETVRNVGYRCRTRGA